MITRFRIEGEEDTKEALIEFLSEKASRIIGVLDQMELGHWECTEDVVTKAKGGYVGRMVMKFKEREHVTDGGECWCDPEVVHVYAGRPGSESE